MGSPPILRRQARPGLKETAEIISVLYSDHDSDLLYGQGGGFQKLFCIFYLQPQDIFSRGAADIFAKEPNQMRLADAGKVREVIQVKMLMIIILYISQQIDQIFRYGYYYLIFGTTVLILAFSITGALGVKERVHAADTEKGSGYKFTDLFRIFAQKPVLITITAVLAYHVGTMFCSAVNAHQYGYHAAVPVDKGKTG